jgi:hypothetical protein
MTQQEKIADDLRQIIFELETHFEYFQRHRLDTDYTNINNIVKTIQDDLEKIKKIKTKILDLS